MAYVYRNKNKQFAKAYCLRCAKPQRGYEYFRQGLCEDCVQALYKQHLAEVKKKQEEQKVTCRRCIRCKERYLTPKATQDGKRICNHCREKKAQQSLRKQPNRTCSHCGLTAEQIGIQYRFTKGMCYKCYQYQRKHGEPKPLFRDCAVCGKKMDVRQEARIIVCSPECGKQRAYQIRAKKNLEKYGLKGEPSWLYNKKPNGSLADYRMKG